MEANTSLLVIDGSPLNNWYKVFKSEKNVKVEQTSWDLIDVYCDPQKCVVEIKPSPGTNLGLEHNQTDPIFGTSQKSERTITPSMVLVRNFVLGIHGTMTSFPSQLQENHM